MRHLAWARLLELTLPGEDDRLLLRMCALEGEACIDATRQWLATIGSPTRYFRAERRGHRRLLPVLAKTVGRTAFDLPEGFADVLHVAELHEALRARTFLRQALRQLEVLRRAAVDVVVLPGVALVPHHYGDPALRHCHDLDLWIEESDLPAAAAAIAAEGASVLPAAARDGSAFLQTESGLQIALHTHLSPLRLFEPPRASLIARRQSMALEGLPFETLCDADLLLYVCLRAVCSSRVRSPLWACDALRLARSPSLDWERFLETARAAGAALPLSVMLRFLADELGAAIPADVGQRLVDANPLSDEIEEVLCHIVVLDPELDARRLARSAPELRLRLALARHLVLPSPSFLQRERGVQGGLALSREYLRRLLRATRRLGGVRRQAGAGRADDAGAEGWEKRT